MASFHEYKRRAIVPLVALALAAFYLLLFLPLSRRAASFDKPLQTAWTNLALALDQTNVLTLDFSSVSNQFNATRQALAILADARQKAAARVELPGILLERINAPFQLVEYQNELSKQMDELDRRAKEQKTAVEPIVFAGFPEHTADLSEPALLWAALFFTDGLLDASLRCKIGTIHSLVVNINPTNSSFTPLNRWAEVPLQFEFTASAANALALIHSLPLRSEEIKAANLPTAPDNKVPLLLDRLIIRKEDPQKLDEVRVWLQAVGFVRRD